MFYVYKLSFVLSYLCAKIFVTLSNLNKVDQQLRALTETETATAVRLLSDSATMMLPMIL